MSKIEKLIGARAAPKSEFSTIGRIPAIIHQTFLSEDLPEGAYAAAGSWIEKNPEFEYRFYDDADQVALIREHFGLEVLAAYHKLPPGAFRADLWRYCVLYQSGGVYADIDTVCRTELTSVLSPQDTFVVPNTGNVPSAVFNAFICCSPQHVVLENAIAQATTAILKASSIDGYSMVGPGALGAALNQSIGAKSDAPHTVGSHDRNGIAYRIIEKRPEENGEPRRVVSGDATVFWTKYDGYLRDLESAGIRHWTADKSQKRPVRKVLNAMRRLRG